MNKKTLKILKATIISLVVSSAFANADTLRLQIPSESTKVMHEKIQNYTVKKDDTLWDISKHFFKDPMEWINIWRHNQQIQNPNLIYPDDVVKLKISNGNYVIEIDGKNINSNKEKKYEKVVEVITPEKTEILTYYPVKSIEYSFLKNFIKDYEVVDSKTKESKPYVLSGFDDTSYLNKGDYVFISGNILEPLESKFNIYKNDGLLKLEKENIGEKFKKIGELKILEQYENYYKGIIIKNSEPIKYSDIVLFDESSNIEESFEPSIYNGSKKGQIIEILDGVNNASVFDSVLIDLGEEDLKIGDVLSLNKKSKEFYDKNKKEKVLLPEKYYGNLIITKTFNKFSIGIILNTKEVIKNGDIAK